MSTPLNNLRVLTLASVYGGVGTRLVTGHTQSALGGVYKLGALKRSRSDWESKMKVSNDSQKTTLPGIHQVKRYNWAKESRFDLIYDIRKPPTKSIRGYDSQHRKMANLSAEDAGVDLLQTIFKKGKLVYTEPKIHEIRNFVKEQLKTLNLENRKVCDNLICKTVIDHSIIEQSSDLITQSDFNLGV